MEAAVRVPVRRWQPGAKQRVRLAERVGSQAVMVIGENLPRGCQALGKVCCNPESHSVA